ncbi:GlxA family transcriptional regulator [Kitasatospora aburaviensis]
MIASGGSALDVSAVRPVDVLIVPGFELSPTLDLDATLADLRPEVASIRSQADSGTAVVSICVGAFLVAEAGLLDGREATTSWLFADRFARRYADVRLRRESLVVTDRGDDHGGLQRHVRLRAAVRPGARRSPHRPQYRADRPGRRRALHADALRRPGAHAHRGQEFSLGVKRWLDQNLGARYDLPALAREFHVSTRTMLRRFAAEAGETPLAYLQAVRVRRARHLLETTDRTVAGIAADVGYRDPGTFSGIFARHTGRRPGSTGRSSAVAEPGSCTVEVNSPKNSLRIASGRDLRSSESPPSRRGTHSPRESQHLLSRNRPA